MVLAERQEAYGGLGTVGQTFMTAGEKTGAANLRRMTVAARVAVALDPACPPDTLAGLAADPSAAVRRVVAEHPQTPPEALSMLAADQDWRTREAIALNPHTPMPALVRLVADPCWQVRWALIQNPALLSPGLQAVIVQSPDATLRAMLAELTNLGAGAAAALVADPDNEVRHRLACRTHDLHLMQDPGQGPGAQGQVRPGTEPEHSARPDPGPGRRSFCPGPRGGPADTQPSRGRLRAAVPRPIGGRAGVPGRVRVGTPAHPEEDAARPGPSSGQARPRPTPSRPPSLGRRSRSGYVTSSSVRTSANLLWPASGDQPTSNA